MFKFFWLCNKKKKVIFNSFWIQKFVYLKNVTFPYLLMLRYFNFCCFFGKVKKKNFIKLFFAVLETIKPLFSILCEHKKKTLFFIPVPLQIKKQYVISLNWLVTMLFGLKKNASLLSNLFFEVSSLMLNKSNKVFTKKNILYFLAIKNQNYKHFRWF